MGVNGVKNPVRCRWLACLLCLTLLWSACLCPAAQASFYKADDEIELGRKVSKELEKHYKLSKDKAQQDRVERLGRALATVSERPELPYTFKVLDVNEINALALPGGPVYVFRGLADYMSDDELAGVIGHEIGHIVKRHSIKQMEKSMNMGLLMLILLRDKGMPLQSVIQQLVMASYSREDEREADYQGFVLTSQAGFNPYSMQRSLEKLAKVHDAPDYGLFSTHPEPDARVNLLKGYIRKNAIRPEVVKTGKNFAIIDGSWSYAADEGVAYELAGALYRVSRRVQLQADLFIQDSDGSNMRIYYDDIPVWTVTPQEAAVAGKTVQELAHTYIAAFRNWVEARQGLP